MANILDSAYFRPSTFAPGIGAPDPLTFGALFGRFMGLDERGNPLGPADGLGGMLHQPAAWPDGKVPPVQSTTAGLNVMSPDLSRLDVKQRARSLEAPAADGGELPTNATETSGRIPTFSDASPPPSGGGSFLDRIGQLIGNNRNTLIALGAGIAGGNSAGDAISKGLAGAASGAQIDQKQAQQTNTANLTERALISRGMAPAEARAISQSPDLVKAVIPQLFGLKPGTQDIQEYEYAKKQGFAGTLEQWMQRKRAGAGEYGMQPIWGVDKDGNPAVMQLGKSGEAVQSKLPEGFKISRDPIKVDNGTHYNLIDPQTRQVVGRVEKDLRGAEREKEIGTSEGQAQAKLPAALIDVQSTSKRIDELLASPGLDSIVGQFDQFRPSWALGDQGRAALSRLDQLQGGAFLQAFNTLKGGGAITEAEGRKAEQAIARMQRYQSEAEFRIALQDFRDAVNDGVKKLQASAGRSGTYPDAIVNMKTSGSDGADLKKKYGLE